MGALPPPPKYSQPPRLGFQNLSFQLSKQKLTLKQHETEENTLKPAKRNHSVIIFLYLLLARDTCSGANSLVCRGCRACRACRACRLCPRLRRDLWDGLVKAGLLECILFSFSFRPLESFRPFLFSLPSCPFFGLTVSIRPVYCFPKDQEAPNYLQNRLCPHSPRPRTQHWVLCHHLRSIRHHLSFRVTSNLVRHQMNSTKLFRAFLTPKNHSDHCDPLCLSRLL